MKSKSRGTFVLSPAEIQTKNIFAQNYPTQYEKEFIYHKTTGDKMKTKIKLILITILLIPFQTMFAQESIKLQEKNQLDSPCPVESSYFHNPPNGTFDVPIFGTILDWVNGAGTVSVELWFGPAGNVVKVYDGPAIISYDLPTLVYNTTYNWYVVCKNDTCGTQGPTNNFLTTQSPTGNFFDPFMDFNNWTILGPSGTTNWSVVNSNLSGGNTPELRLSWTPSFVGVSNIRSVNIPLPNNILVSYSFNFFFDWYANPSGSITVGVTYDGGLTTYDFYTLTDPTGNVGPMVIWGSFTTPGSGSQNTQIEIKYDGNSFNIDNIYFDNMRIEWCLSCYPPSAPTNLTAQVIFNPNPQVQLNWQDNSWNENGFRIYRKKGYPSSQTNYVLVGVMFSDFTQVVDSTVLPESTYTYKVVAYNDFGENNSNTATIEVSVPVGIEEITNEMLTEEFALHQNYPNPFNPSTKIKYQIPLGFAASPFNKGGNEGGFVTLKVYDILGNEVATLVNEEQAPGVYEVEFNVNSHSGEVRNLTSGIYFYQFRVRGPEINSGQGIIETKKMILLK